MSDYYIYASASTGHFVKISDKEINDPNLISVPSVPPHAHSKWQNQQWTALTPEEIQATVEEDEIEDFEPVEILTENITTPNSLVFWGNSTGDQLINSKIILKENTLSFPFNLNLINKQFLINGLPLDLKNSQRDRQKVIETNEKSYDKTTWQQVPDMRLTSRNLAASLYKIEIEILVKTSRNNRDFEFALFVNGKQQNDNLLHIDFNRGNDDKTLSWSDELELEPSSIIALFWRRVGNSVKCTVARRKLAITQLESSGLLDTIEPEPIKTNWLFLGEGGKEFSHGNGSNNDIRYRDSMSLVRDSEGLYFRGEKPFASWVKIEFLKWKRGEGKTLKMVFAGTNGIYHIGIGSNEIDEKSRTLYFGAELMVYMSDRSLFNIVGNKGKTWQGTQTRINKPITTKYHRLEIENDGGAGSAIRIFDLPYSDRDSWDNKDSILYEEKIESIHQGDAPLLMPFFIPQNGSGFKIIAVQVN